MSLRPIRLEYPVRHQGAVWHYRQPGQHHPLHRHAELELNLVVRGQAVYLLEDRRLELDRHSALWLFPTQSHVLMYQSADFEMWILVFRPALVLQLTTGITASQGGCRLLGESPALRLTHLFAELAAAQADTARFNAGLAYALLSAWAAHQQATAQMFGDAMHPAIERAARILRDDPTRSIAAVATAAGLSDSRLSRLFHQQTGITLVEYRNRQRLERYLALRAAGPQRTVTEAALEAGFGSYPQFHRVFTRLLGASPKHYSSVSSVGLSQHKRPAGAST